MTRRIALVLVALSIWSVTAHATAKRIVSLLGDKNIYVVYSICDRFDRNGYGVDCVRYSGYLPITKRVKVSQPVFVNGATYKVDKEEIKFEYGDNSVTSNPCQMGSYNNLIFIIYPKHIICTHGYGVI